MKRFIGLALALVMVLAVIAGCAAAPEPEASTGIVEPESSEIAIADPSESAPAEEAPVEETPAGIGPDMLLLKSTENMSDKFAEAWGNPGWLDRTLMWSRLLKLDSDLNVTGYDLAKEYTVSADGLHYEFKLNEGVKWHDGEDFTSADVVTSIKAALKAAATNSVLKNAFMCIKGGTAYAQDNAKTIADDVEGLTAPDDFTVVIDMEKASGTFLLACAQFNIFPDHILSTYDNTTLADMAKTSYYDWPIGTGPYMVTEFVPNDYALLEYFPDYWAWDSEPDIKTVKMTQMTQADYPVNALADTLDYVYTNDLNTALAMLENPNYTAFYTDIFFVRYLSWNSFGQKGNGEDPLKDIKARRAIVKAIDRQALIDAIFPGQATVTDSTTPASMAYYNDQVPDLSYDPEAAKALLDEVGFDYDYELKLACYYTDQGTTDFMNAVCEYLAAVGVKATWWCATGDITAQLYEERDYNLMYAGHSCMAPEERYGNTYSVTVLNGSSKMLYPNEPNAKYDALYEELQVCVDNARRTELMKELQAVEMGEMLYQLPILALRNIQVFNTARVQLPADLVLSNEWTNYDRHFNEWILNAGE